MKFKLNEKYQYKNTMSIFAIAAVLIGALCSLVALMDVSAFTTLAIVPFAAAFLALILVFSFPKKHGVTIFAVISLAICILAAVVNSVSLYAVVLSIVIGLCIALTYILGKSKPEAVVITAAAAIAVTLLTLWLFSADRTGNYAFGSVREFYVGIFSDFKALTLDSVRTGYLNLQETISPEELDALLLEISLYFDNLAFLLPAILVILALIIIGFSFKMFGVMVYKYSKQNLYILKWRFITTNTFVAFYIVLLIMNIFVSGTGVFAVSVANLYSIMNFVYAYIGYNFVTALLAQKMRLGFARIITIAAILLFSSFSLQVLAIGGVIFTFLCNKAGDMPSGNDGNGN